MEYKAVAFSSAFRGEVAEGKYKVMTKSGKDVEIVRWEGHPKYPVIGIVDGLGYNYTGDGVVQDGLPHGFDLVVVTDRLVMDGFESALAAAFDSFLAEGGSSGTVFAARFGASLSGAAGAQSVPSWRVATRKKWMSDDDDSYGFLVKGKENCVAKDGLRISWMYDTGDMYIPVSELLERLPVEGK